MRLFLAAAYSNGFVDRPLTDVESAARAWGAISQLESYHYVQKQNYVDKMRRDRARVFLDSGAFSAHTKGTQIDLDAYCAYIHNNRDLIEFASVLDAIGDARRTYENQIEMERQGCRVVPCFHYGEDVRYLDWYISNYEYIALGGLVIAGYAQLVNWLDKLFEQHLCDSKGKPRVKVHGFALTSLNVMLRYPWHSVDSSSWVQLGMYGHIMIPELKRPVTVSAASLSTKVHDRHFDTYDGMSKATIAEYVTNAGFDIERLRTGNYAPRAAFNCYAFRRLEQMATKTDEFVFKRPEQELFA